MNFVSSHLSESIVYLLGVNSVIHFVLFYQQLKLHDANKNSSLLFSILFLVLTFLFTEEFEKGKFFVAGLISSISLFVTLSQYRKIYASKFVKISVIVIDAILLILLAINFNSA